MTVNKDYDTNTELPVHGIAIYQATNPVNQYKQYVPTKLDVGRVDIFTLSIQEKKIITYEQGYDIFKYIRAALSYNHRVMLDFSEVDILTAPAANAIIEIWFRDKVVHTPDEFADKIIFVGAKRVIYRMLQQTIKTCFEYYSDQQFRSAVDETIREMITNER